MRRSFPARLSTPNDRPAWLVNVTNDAWFGNSSGPRQHLAAARMRAVEEGLPLMRAANTGITAAFDARGHELGRIGMQTAGTLVVALPSALPPTLFAQLGPLVTGNYKFGCTRLRPYGKTEYSAGLMGFGRTRQNHEREVANLYI